MRTLTGMLNDRDTLRIEWTRFQSYMVAKTWDNRKFALCLIGTLLSAQRLQLLVGMQKEKNKNPREIIGGIIARAQPAPVDRGPCKIGAFLKVT